MKNQTNTSPPPYPGDIMQYVAKVEIDERMREIKSKRIAELQAQMVEAQKEIDGLYKELKRGYVEVPTKKKPKLTRYVYEEDHQMYYKTWIVFETDSELSIKEMKALSHTPPGAGRMSTSFKTFQKLLGGNTRKVREYKKLEDVMRNVPKETRIVKGATGNY
jgi:hypothetical protein